MANKTFTFIKLDTGGRLEVEAASEKAAREKMKLDPAIWEVARAEPEPKTEPTD